MKSLAVLLLLSLPAVAQYSSLSRVGGGGGFSDSFNPPGTTLSKKAIVYPMEKIPPTSPKFTEILDLINAQNQQRKSGQSIKIIQTAASGEFLARFTQASSFFLLRLPGQSHADDSTLYLQIEKTNELHTYTDVMGATRTVPVYTASATEPERMTPGALQDSLQIGNTFRIWKTMPTSTCATCNGFGKIPIKEGPRKGDAKITCSPCHGKGKITIYQEIIVTWKPSPNISGSGN